MKLQNRILCFFASTIVSFSAFAQSGGHVGKHRVQHQQDAPRPQKLVLGQIQGRGAKNLYFELLSDPSLEAKEVDLSSHCSQPVFRLQGWSIRKHRWYECFDRGDHFGNESRYRCYSYRTEYRGMITLWRAKNNHAVKRAYNPCGGDGNIPIDDTLDSSFILRSFPE